MVVKYSTTDFVKMWKSSLKVCMSFMQLVYSLFLFFVCKTSHVPLLIINRGSLNSKLS